ncbi:MAG: RNA-binding cell elongation regulator Jag/EloR [Candidatus Fimisoma sp.]|nr:RNA-binding cell elongation regulator Jag/EloR [Candidatus Fimisoma sp.]
MSMDFSEKWGTDIDTAVELALADLKLTIDEVDVTVLEEPSRGFFGIGSKLALVRVEKKKTQEVKEPEKKEKKTVEKAEKAQTQKTATPKKEEIKKEIEVKEENLVPCEDHEALRFLKEVIKEMGLDLDITAKKGENSLYLDIQGKDSGTIIGKRGQTLDAIQYLTSLVANKESDEYTRVVVDAENYRAKREKTLEALANRLANKVVKTKRSVKLEPMNPYERKVIHAALHDHPKVVTRSEGQDPYRRVVIELK